MKEISGTYYFTAERKSNDVMPNSEENKGIIIATETTLYYASAQYAEKSSIIKSVIHKKSW